MNANFAAPIRTRIAAFAAAVLASTTVLGATVIGMQRSDPHVGETVIALERVVVSASAVH